MYVKSQKCNGNELSPGETIRRFVPFRVGDATMNISCVSMLCAHSENVMI